MYLIATDQINYMRAGFFFELSSRNSYSRGFVGGGFVDVSSRFRATVAASIPDSCATNPGTFSRAADSCLS